VAAFAGIALAPFAVRVMVMAAMGVFTFDAAGALGTRRAAVAFCAMRAAVAEAFAVRARVAVMSCPWMHVGSFKKRH
jgi:hypothetical protein